MNGATPKEKTGRLEKYRGWFEILAGFPLDDATVVQNYQKKLMQDAEEYFKGRNPGKEVWGAKVVKFEERNPLVEGTESTQRIIWYEITLMVEE
jgi:hypothetical protein